MVGGSRSWRAWGSVDYTESLILVAVKWARQFARQYARPGGRVMDRQLELNYGAFAHRVELIKSAAEYYVIQHFDIHDSASFDKLAGNANVFR